MRIFERLRARYDAPPDQLKTDANDVGKGMIPKPTFEPPGDAACCGHCSGQHHAARDPGILVS